MWEWIVYNIAAPFIFWLDDCLRNPTVGLVSLVWLFTFILLVLYVSSSRFQKGYSGVFRANNIR